MPVRTLRRAVLGLAILLASALVRPAAASAQESIQICSNQAVPAGYVITQALSRLDCPAYSSTTPNSYTIRLPGDNVTVCSTLSTLGPDYVVTARRASLDCPGYSSRDPNTTTYQRVPVAGPAAPSGADGGGMALLDAYDRDVLAHLGELQEMMGLRTPTHRTWMGSQAQGGTARAGMQVEGGRRYTLVAACDADCADLDVRVLDGSYVVAQDVEPGESARLELTPASAGTLTVEVVMAACERAPCRYAVSVHETPSLSARPRP